MATQLAVSVGQASDRGRKAVNQDFHGLYAPQNPLLRTKGIVCALADGISSSEVSQVASETAVATFLEDYYCTSQAWSVKKSAQRVLAAINAWLYAQTRSSRYRDNADRGYVCAFSAVVFKSTTAHIFHVGDARIYRLQGRALEQLTEDHRIQVSANESYLGRALGVNPQVEIDYQTLGLQRGDTFLMLTDGVYEYVDSEFIVSAVQRAGSDLDAAARALVEAAFAYGSADNLTAQIIRVDALPAPAATDIGSQLQGLAFPPPLQARMHFGGYEIMRELHVSSRSYVYLAKDPETGTQVALKTPGSDVRNDPVLLERFLLEEWIGRRLDNPHVVKPVAPGQPRAHIYVVFEYIEGQSLTQWMIDHPAPDIEQVRTIVEQIAKGLLAFHRQEMLHQDLRPANLLIDATGTVKIIDFGATAVAGITETAGFAEHNPVLGTQQYAAPEYFLGAAGSVRSDIFSLGVITYEMLTGELPYGTRVSQARSRTEQQRLKYRSAAHGQRHLPLWMDAAIRRAVHPNLDKRYAEVSEFVYDLRHPNKAFMPVRLPPLIERYPERFWQGLSLTLALVILGLLLVLQQ